MPEMVLLHSFKTVQDYKYSSDRYEQKWIFTFYLSGEPLSNVQLRREKYIVEDTEEYFVPNGFTPTEWSEALEHARLTGIRFREKKNARK